MGYIVLLLMIGVFGLISLFYLAYQQNKPGSDRYIDRTGFF